MSTNFNDTKEKLIIQATRVAGTYLLSKYGSAHLKGEPKVELTAQINPISNAIEFNGAIIINADVEHGTGFSEVGINMTVNENDIQVESEDLVADITNSLNSASETNLKDNSIHASLDAFSLLDDGSPYLKVSHPALNSVSLGQVGKNEYQTSPDRAELLKTIAQDAISRTASYDATLTFTGEFKEPVIEKYIEATVKEDDKCLLCKDAPRQRGEDNCSLCEEKLQEKRKEHKKSWLGNLNEEVHNPLCPNCNQQMQPAGETAGMEHYWCEDCDYEGHIPASESTISISENMPKASSADHLAQSKQAEEQFVSAAQEKIKNAAANAIVSMLQSMGYGSAKVAEVSSSAEGFDLMTTLDDAGTTKAVSIPVTVKDSTVVLPKKSLVATLVSKGLDIRARFSEDFSKEILEKIAAIEEKVAYEQAEANAIIAERSPVKKEASGYDNTQFLGDQDIMEIQKHLLPDHESLKKGDKVSDGNSQWEIVDTEGHQNDKNEGSSSIWKLRKCEQPKSDDKEPKTKISI